MKHFKKVFRVLSLALALLIALSPIASAITLDDATKSVARVYTEVFINSAKYNLTDFFMSAYIGSSIAVGEAKNKSVEYFVTNSHVINPREYMIDWCYSTAASLLKDDAVFAAMPQSEQKESLQAMAYEVFQNCSFDCKSYIVFDTIDTAVPLTVIHDCYIDSVSKDIAIVRIGPTEKRIPAVLRDSDSMKRTDTVYTIGFPGIGDRVANEKEASELRSDLDFITTTKGSVSRLVTKDECRFVQIDAAINGGNSGGALVDENGCVIGMPTFTYNDGEAANYAVASTEIMAVLDQFGVKYEKLQTGFFGKSLPLVIAMLVILAAACATILLYRKGKKPAQHDERMLICVEGALKNRRFPIKGKLIVGREANKCQVEYPSSTEGVSRKHCEIFFDGQHVYVTDLGSTYGTYINKKKLAPNMPAELHRSEPLWIGSENNVFIVQ